ncbi:hypothetical protein Tco_0559973 [Tanacetum coccineum]
MHDEFKIGMMGELNFFLGLQVKQMEDGIFFNQSKYIKEMLKKFGLEDSKPNKTSMSTEIKLTKDDEANSVDSTKYQAIPLPMMKSLMITDAVYIIIMIMIIPNGNFCSKDIVELISHNSSKINSPNYKRKTATISVNPTYVNLESSSEKHQNERTPSPPPRKKSLSPPHAPSKSTSSRSTYQTTSSSLSESPTPTYVAPPPKLRFVIPMKLEPQELPPQHLSPHDPYVSTMNNWPLGPSNLSSPPRVSHPLPESRHPPPEFEHPPPSQPLFVNINNNAP